MFGSSVAPGGAGGASSAGSMEGLYAGMVRSLWREAAGGGTALLDPANAAEPVRLVLHTTPLSALPGLPAEDEEAEAAEPLHTAVAVGGAGGDEEEKAADVVESAAAGGVAAPDGGGGSDGDAGGGAEGDAPSGADGAAGGGGGSGEAAVARDGSDGDAGGDAGGKAAEEVPVAATVAEAPAGDAEEPEVAVEAIVHGLLARLFFPPPPPEPAAAADGSGAPPPPDALTLAREVSTASSASADEEVDDEVRAARLREAFGLSHGSALPAIGGSLPLLGGVAAYGGAGGGAGGAGLASEAELDAAFAYAAVAPAVWSMPSPEELRASAEALKAATPGSAEAMSAIRARLPVVRVPVSFLRAPEDLRSLLDELTYMMYHGCDVRRRARAEHICVLMLLVGTTMSRRAVRPALAALGRALKSNNSASGRAFRWYSYLLSDECPISLNPQVREVIGKSKVVAEIARLQGWECRGCQARSPHEMETCRLCTLPKRRHAGLGPPPAMLRLPSDLDAAFYQPPPGELRELDALTSAQRAAVDHIVREAQPKSNEARASVMAKLTALGYREKDFRRLERFIRDEAMLICHVNLSKTLGFLVKDTHYRNQFETATSGGCLSTSARTEWERRCFGPAYDSASGFERPKYGVLNLSNDPQGVQSCRQYGESYMVLKDVRLRCSFADMDTSSPSVSLASCEYYQHVLDNYTIQELQAIVEVATGKAAFHPSNCVSNYKELQVHGPLSLRDHVSALVVNTMHKGNEEIERQLAEFSSVHGVPIVWMAETQAEAAARKQRKEAEERRKRDAAERAERERRRLEALKWTCWGCTTRSTGTSDSCTACGMGKPTVTPATAARVAWDCTCGAANAGDAMRCVTCGSAPPTWMCIGCSVVNPNCNLTCSLCSTERPVEDVSAEWTCGTCTATNPATRGACAICGTVRHTSSVGVGGRTVGGDVDISEWACGACTSVNHTPTGDPSPTCTMCGTPRPPGVAPSGGAPAGGAPAGGGVGAPAPGPVYPPGPWDCRVCTVKGRDGSLTSCDVCGTPRPPPSPGSGPPSPPPVPVAARGPIRPRAAVVRSESEPIAPFSASGGPEAAPAVAPVAAGGSSAEASAPPAALARSVSIESAASAVVTASAAAPAPTSAAPPVAPVGVVSASGGGDAAAAAAPAEAAAAAPVAEPAAPDAVAPVAAPVASPFASAAAAAGAAADAAREAAAASAAGAAAVAAGALADAGTGPWTCVACTFRNPGSGSTVCGLCGAAR